jgi:hypothetical protein
MKVDVYKNLHKDVFSVKCREPINRGKVLKHTNNALIADVEFAVQPAGRIKVIRSKRKNVHAFVRGTLVDLSQESLDSIARTHEMVEVTYNPYKHGAFYETKSQHLRVKASFVLIKDKKVFAFQPS